MHMQYTNSVVKIDGPGKTLVVSSFCAAGQSNAGSSQRDPLAHHVPSFTISQQDIPPQDAAFDRFYSLVEVCAAAGSPLTPLIPPTPGPYNDTLSTSYSPQSTLSPMVRAPPSDTEDEPDPILSFRADSAMLHRDRRRHACKMCNKSFDRPSTLKTHLLVHTGVTPFACNLCGRRFSVQSNCNRHIRRCTIRSELFLARRLEIEASQAGSTHSLAQRQSESSSRLIPRSSSTPVPPRPKRARRKRSPAAAWIPHSLATFTLPSTHIPAPIPLPPVIPQNGHEERDSYILCHDQPYTAEGWSGRLPGPAPPCDLISKTSSDLMNTSSR